MPCAEPELHATKSPHSHVTLPIEDYALIGAEPRFQDERIRAVAPMRARLC
jgi:hypothetical protein